MMNEREKIDLITQISLDINEVKDLDLLLERILTNARKFCNADAGSIYLKENSELKFSITQNETLQKRLEPGKKLIYNTYSIPIANMSIAGYVANNDKTVNIPDVYAMGSNVPYSFDSSFDRLSDYQSKSMLTIPMVNQHDDVIGVMQLINARDDNGDIISFVKSDEPLISHFATSAALALERAQMTRNIILRMISMSELRDPMETGSHVNRVAAYSIELYEDWAKGKQIPTQEMEKQKDILRMASMLHDVGKVAISDLILKKPSRLTVNEFEIMKSHTFMGARLFQNIQSDFDELAAEVALNHHEKWDGTGYPGHIDPITEQPIKRFVGKDGVPWPKKEEEIPLFGRIVALADVYDALCSRRCYKDPWGEEQIIEEIHSSSGTHFDPEICNSFFRCLDVLKSVRQRYPDREE